MQLCSSRHFELYRSVGDCLYAAIFLAGLAPETVKLASVHGFDAVNTLRHSMASSYALEEERTKDCKPTDTHMRTGTGRTNADRPLGPEEAQDTQKQELPSRSPELAGTKTQLSLGREKNRVYTRVCVCVCGGSGEDSSISSTQFQNNTAQHIWKGSTLAHLPSS